MKLDLPNKDLEKAIEVWRSEGMSEDEINKMAATLSQSLALRPSLGLKRRLDDIKAGVLAPVPWPWRQTTALCPCLTPGAVTVVAGPPGASKSFGLLQCINFWSNEGYEVSLLAIEGKRDQHVHRLLAQIDGNGNLTDMDWIAQNPNEVDAAFARHADWLDVVGRCVCTVDMASVNYYDVLDWIEARGRLNDKVIVVDPITCADPQGQQWEQDRALVYKSQQIARKYNTSIVLVSHPSKHTSGPSLDALAGGTAYQRHVDAVLWLQAIEPKEVTIMSPCGRCEIEINRCLHLLKVRDGRGQGKTLGFRFDPQTLTLAEQGVILKEKTKQEL